MGYYRRSTGAVFMKFMLWVIGVILIGIFTLLPEVGLFIIWHIVSPVTETGRIMLAGLFVIAGGGICWLFVVLGVAAFVAWSAAMLDV